MQQKNYYNDNKNQETDFSSQKDFEQQGFGYDESSNKHENRNDRNDSFFVKSVNLNFSSFSGFITSVRDQNGLNDQNRGDNPYERDVPIVPDSIVPEENEIIIKQYNICKLRTRLKFMKAEGRLMITNRRVLFRAAGTSLTGDILQEHQFNIDEIGGVHMQKDYKFSLLNYLFACIVSIIPVILAVALISKINDTGTRNTVCIIVGILGLLPFISVDKHFWFKFICSSISLSALAMVGAYLKMASRFSSDSTFLKIFFVVLFILAIFVHIINTIILCFIPNFRLEIKTKGATGALVIKGTTSILVKLFLPWLALAQREMDCCGFEDVMPWEDTVMAINEVGTMIDDIQKNGDYAIEKWSK
jgi:hypothetical protein